MSKKQRAGCRVNRAARRVTARYCRVNAHPSQTGFITSAACGSNDADMFSGGGLAHQFIVGQRYFQDKFGMNYFLFCAEAASVCLWLLVSGRLLREDNVSGSMAPDMYAATIGNVDRAVANHTNLGSFDTSLLTFTNGGDGREYVLSIVPDWLALGDSVNAAGPEQKMKINSCMAKRDIRAYSPALPTSLLSQSLVTKYLRTDHKAKFDSTSLVESDTDDIFQRQLDYQYPGFASASEVSSRYGVTFDGLREKYELGFIVQIGGNTTVVFGAAHVPHLGSYAAHFPKGKCAASPRCFNGSAARIACKIFVRLSLLYHHLSHYWPTSYPAVSLPTGVLTAFRSSIYKPTHITANAHLFINHDWIDPVQLCAFLKRGDTTRVKIENDASLTRHLTASNSTDFGYDFSFLEQFNDPAPAASQFPFGFDQNNYAFLTTPTFDSELAALFTPTAPTSLPCVNPEFNIPAVLSGGSWPHLPPVPLSSPLEPIVDPTTASLEVSVHDVSKKRTRDEVDPSNVLHTSRIRKKPKTTQNSGVAGANHGVPHFGTNYSGYSGATLENSQEGVFYSGSLATLGTLECSGVGPVRNAADKTNNTDIGVLACDIYPKKQTTAAGDFGVSPHSNDRVGRLTPDLCYDQRQTSANPGPAT
ncbi:hypothetical protein C8R44DRAFT_731313 [Mycena epipterygia]|nr:hypothetical protein C8R44DRAFT_731313 [Mycena epipterygia]